MKRLIIVLLIVLSVSVVWAGEKEELQWKAKAVIAEFQLAQSRFNQTQDAVNDLIKELDAKGFIFQDGKVVEKPKPAPKKEEPPKK